MSGSASQPTSLGVPSPSGLPPAGKISRVKPAGAAPSPAPPRRERDRLGEIIGASPAMQHVFDLIEVAAACEANVIVYGESGTGKELVARAIHDLSARRAGSFVPVNCGAVPETLMESEFFGYRRGAFSGALIDKHGYLDLADGGTLFLDELGEIGPGIQVKLLRAIDGGGFIPVGGGEVKRPDFRVIAATHRDLLAEVRRGRLREDFFYRIHVLPIHLPPLRERREDIALLAEHFALRFGGRNAAPPIPSHVLEALSTYDWPGNIRELQNTVHRYLVFRRLDFTGGRGMRPESVPRGEDCASAGGAAEGLEEMMRRYERGLILRALEENRWQREATAAALGIHRKTLFTKMRKYGLLSPVGARDEDFDRRGRGSAAPRAGGAGRRLGACRVHRSQRQGGALRRDGRGSRPAAS